MNQTIEEITARFVRHNWLVKKVKDNYWTVQPKGTYNYKVFILIYNPFDQKFHLVKSPTPHNPWYQDALRILEGSDPLPARKSDRSRQFNLSSDLSIIKVPSMFPVKISPTKWINLAEVREVTLDEKGGLFVVWVTGDYITFEGEEVDTVLRALTEAYETALRRLGSA